MQTGPAAKRSKTLTQEVAKLKKQVSQNKHEVKYYDGTVVYDSSNPVSPVNSFIINTDNPPTFTRANLFGRKMYVHKIEYRYSTSTVGSTRLIYRNKKGLKTPNVANEWPLLIDPEFHTMLRYSEGGQDTQKSVHIGTIDFKNAPRLVEFDNPAEQETPTPSITKGDIRFYSTSDGSSCTFRLWYHDG